MIVLCPACQTRFRTSLVPQSSARTAVCSRCDGEFPLAPAKRTYLLRGLVEVVPARVSADGAAAMEKIVPGQPPTPANRRSPFVESLIALLPALAGAGLAYDLAGRNNQDTIAWAALGGAVGLLLGWACLLWIARKD